jgi:cation diffusion facilitator family transporter
VVWSSQVDSRERQQQQRYRVTQRATLVGAGVNLLLAVVKILFGVIGHSQSLLADGLHSLSDLLSDGLVLFAAYHAKEAPDDEHPYGHGRFETAGTLALGLFLFLVGAGVIWDAVERLFSPEALLVPSMTTLWVAAFSIVANEALYFYTQHLAKQIRSDLLRANAWHHRSDSISSVVVLVGIGGTLVGLPYLDAIAAVLVGLMILHIGWQLVWQSVHELVDSGLEEQRVEEIKQVITSVAGVKDVHMLRTRKMGGHASADVHVQVASWLSVSEGHRISEVVMQRLLESVEELVDVTVHIDPEDDESTAPCGHLPLRTEAEQRLQALWQDLPCFDRRMRLVLHYISGRIDVDLFFPLDCSKSVSISEELAERYQAQLQEAEQFGRVRLWFG